MKRKLYELASDGTPVFSGEYIKSKLASMQIEEDLQNHLVFDHSYTDNLSIALSVFNLAMIIFIIYKLNTNKNR